MAIVEHHAIFFHFYSCLSSSTHRLPNNSTVAEGGAENGSFYTICCQISSRVTLPCNLMSFSLRFPLSAERMIFTREADSGLGSFLIIYLSLAPNASRLLSLLYIKSLSIMMSNRTSTGSRKLGVATGYLS
jgi:hypothetical protein